MSFTNMIEKRVSKYPELKIIDARHIYKEQFSEIPEQAFYQAVSRMAKTGEIERLTKGIYCRPKAGKFGKIVSSEKDILEYYLGKNEKKGIVVGYRMYNTYGLTTQIPKNVQVYSNVPIQEKREIRNVSVKKVNLKFEETTKRLIELLEVLQNYSKIEDLHSGNLRNFISAVVGHYDEKTLEKLLKEIGYKKSTLASLKNVLDYFNISNTVSKYLNGTSKYETLDVEKLYGTAP